MTDVSHQLPKTALNQTLNKKCDELDESKSGSNLEQGTSKNDHSLDPIKLLFFVKEIKAELLSRMAKQELFEARGLEGVQLKLLGT